MSSSIALLGIFLQVFVTDTSCNYANPYGRVHPEYNLSSLGSGWSQNDYLDQIESSAKVRRSVEKCRERANLKPFEPIRIKCFSKSDRNVITETMDSIVKYFKENFRVRRSSYTIGILERTDCSNAGNFYPTHIRPDFCNRNERTGVPDADYLIYIREVNCPAGYLAFAQQCSSVTFDNRPVAGYVHICPKTTYTQDWNKHALKRTLQHELMHALGFNRPQLNRIKITVKRKWRINSLYVRDHSVEVVPTPRVKSFVRYHFNCSTLEGAEIENEGPATGTAGVHWEVRIFGPETMTGYISRRSYISALTMAYFEDTRWYKTDYKSADNYTFAFNYSCAFAMGSCREFIDFRRANNLSPKPFCTWEDYVEKLRRTSNPRECSADRTFYSKCDWKEVDESKEEIYVNKQYYHDKWTVIDGKNITGANVYGAHEARDGCPQWSEYYFAEARKEKIGDSICQNKFSQPPAIGNWAAELFGHDSKCFEHEGKFEVFDCWPLGISSYDAEREQGAGCYRYKCSHNRLMIQANYSAEADEGHFSRQYKVCWGKGSVIQIQRHQFSGKNFGPRFHKGVIVCPDCREICGNNPKYPNFICAKDISLNSTDYAGVPCPQEAAYEQAASGAVKWICQDFVLILLLVVSKSGFQG